LQVRKIENKGRGGKRENGERTKGGGEKGVTVKRGRDSKGRERQWVDTKDRKLRQGEKRER
jgi:hypothetical protein